MTDENYTDIFAQLAEAANKFAEIADKAEKNLGAIVSQLDEIRREVTKMNGGKA